MLNKHHWKPSDLLSMTEEELAFCIASTSIWEKEVEKARKEMERQMKRGR